MPGMPDKDPYPDDPITGKAAGAMFGRTAKTIHRWAQAGRFREWKHPDHSGWEYSLSELVAYKARFEQTA